MKAQAVVHWETFHDTSTSDDAIQSVSRTFDNLALLYQLLEEADCEVTGVEATNFNQGIIVSFICEDIEHAQHVCMQISLIVTFTVELRI